MLSKIASRFRPTKSKHRAQDYKKFSPSFNSAQIIHFFGGPLLLFYYFLSMALYYHVVGAVKCPKIKKHAGVKLRPFNKAKEPFAPNDMLIYTCETTEHSQSLKCLDNGQWNETPYCPDPINNTCPELSPLQHGSYNSSGPPYRVGTIIAFRCDNEEAPNLPPLTTATPTTTASANTSFQQYQNISASSETQVPRFNLTGHRQIKCLASSKWNHPMPLCTPFAPEPASNVSLVLTSAILILIPILIIITVFHLFMRWRKRQQQRERWKQYFTDYKYRHSKTSITFGMRPSPSTVPSNPIPVTDL